MKQEAIRVGQEFPTENCRYLAKDGYFYKDILSSPDALRKDARTQKHSYVQLPAKQYVPKK